MQRNKKGQFVTKNKKEVMMRVTKEEKEFIQKKRSEQNE